MYKIEKNIDIPPHKNTRYPFGVMKVGDSFFVEGGKSNALSCAARLHARRHGGKFTVRQVDGGVRVWRIA